MGLGFFSIGIMIEVFHSVGIVAVRYDWQKSECRMGVSSMGQLLTTLVGMPSGPRALPALQRAADAVPRPL